jgi:hypothetical protein
MGIFQISFGTNCWPTVPEYIDEVIRALIEKGVPFVRSFLPYTFVDPFTFFMYSDILPCISLCQNFRRNYEQHKFFRPWISDYLGATAIHLESPGRFPPPSYHNSR